jgi:hypothetical protein
MRKLEQFAQYLADGFGCSRLIRITTDSDQTHTQVLSLGAQPIPSIESSSSADRQPRLEGDVLGESIVVCQVRSELASAGALLPRLRDWLDYAPAAILLMGQNSEFARPAELQQWLFERGLVAPFVGWAPAEPYSTVRRLLIAVLERNSRPPLTSAPRGFRVVAFIPAYNEADIIRHSLQYLIAQDIDVYVVDNWSSDTTFEQAEQWLGKGLIGIERFPATGPVDSYEWRSILGRIESLVERIDADWFMVHDADERRQSPWRGADLKTGLFHVDRCGFNCVDHVVLHYWPTDRHFDPRRDVAGQLQYGTFSDHVGHFHQRRAWKNLRCAVSLAPSAGHDVRFPGRLVYPFKFLLKHYPIRSQAHGERKVFEEREPRWNSEERSLGWHRQYEHIERGDTFVRDPATLDYADEPTFDERYLIERLSGIGVFEESPPWATGPRQSFDAAPQPASQT